ncbi:MAG: tripartite tricarboxylate transporter TctB family protein [Rhizobiaceae bacterium]
MKLKSINLTAELISVAVLLVLSCMSLLTLNFLVAPPKVLFGRSLTAIPPSLFPAIVITLLSILCVMWLVHLARQDQQAVSEPGISEGIFRAVALFAIMTFYALAMVPFGFLISSVISLSAISWLVGNRSIWQIALLSIVSPVALYLVATRLLAVSLPELSPIEFAYSRILGG